ncbi:hypothetical protein PAAL109150_07890 [Paenibacillus alkaliterrae]
MRAMIPFLFLKATIAYNYGGYIVKNRWIMITLTGNNASCNNNHFNYFQYEKYSVREFYLHGIAAPRYNKNIRSFWRGGNDR